MYLLEVSLVELVTSYMVYPFREPKNTVLKPSENDQEDSQSQEDERGLSWRFGVNKQSKSLIGRVSQIPTFRAKSDRAAESSRQSESPRVKRKTGEILRLESLLTKNLVVLKA